MSYRSCAKLRLVQVQLLQLFLILNLKQKLKALDAIISALFEEGNPVGIKTALHLKGVCTNTMRLPLVSGSEALQEKMKKLIAEYEK